MATLVLPVDSADPHYTVDVDLEGVSYTLELYWNARAGAWFFSLFRPDVVDPDGDPIPLVAGRRVVIGTNLCGPTADARIPPGLIMAIDTGTTNADPGAEDLGSRVLLVYDESTGA